MSDGRGVDRPLRVLHAPTDVGGHASGLARAERELGVDSVSVAFDGDPFGNESDRLLYAPGDGFLARERKRWRFLRESVRSFDVVHLNFGRTLLPQCRTLDDPFTAHQPWWRRVLQAGYARLFEQRDLRWFRANGVKLCVTFQGDDARQGDHCRSHHEVSFVDRVPPGYYSSKSDRMKRRRIARFDAHCDAIFSLNPDLQAVLPPRTEFLPYANVDPADWRPVTPDNPRPVVVHAPSHRDVKGTDLLLDAVDRLRAEGLDFELELVENLPRREARKRYERADVVVDQLLAGWYGGLAVECMALGKPVVAYLRETDLAHVHPAMRADLPIVPACPSSITSVLRDLLTSPRSRRLDLGRRSREYVERWHTPRAVAARTTEVYRHITGRRGGIEVGNCSNATRAA